MTVQVTLQLEIEDPDGTQPVLLGRDGDMVHSPASITVDFRVDGEPTGPWVSGTKGARFVYAGLPRADGTWLRRWKWRDHQLRELAREFGKPGFGAITLILGSSVTPDMRGLKRGTFDLVDASDAADAADIAES